MSPGRQNYDTWKNSIKSGDGRQSDQTAIMMRKLLFEKIQIKVADGQTSWQILCSMRVQKNQLKFFATSTMASTIIKLSNFSGTLSAMEHIFDTKSKAWKVELVQVEKVVIVLCHASMR